MATICNTPSAQITGIDRMSGNDLTVLFTMQYKLQSEPDTSYLPVTTTKDIMGVTMPWFDIGSVNPGIYIVHTYFTSDGPATGTKVAVEVTCNDELT